MKILGVYSVYSECLSRCTYSLTQYQAFVKSFLQKNKNNFINGGTVMELNYKIQRNGLYILSKQRGDFDVIAERILREYQPSVLANPSPLDLDALAKDKLGLSVKEQTFANDSGIIGVMIFGSLSGRLRYRPRKTENYFDTGIVLLDTGLENSADGRKRFTYAHEVAHWLIHRPYHAYIARKNGDTQSYAACLRSDLQFYKPQNDYEWQEWQANALASALLMPKATFAAAMTDIFGTDNTSWIYCAPGRRGNLGTIAAAISEIYGVSKTAAKLRLNELGYIRNLNIEYD
jgi:hypothetical protein